MTLSHCLIHTVFPPVVFNMQIEHLRTCTNMLEINCHPFPHLVFVIFRSSDHQAKCMDFNYVEIMGFVRYNKSDRDWNPRDYG